MSLGMNITAVFQPKRTDDLYPEVIPLIGRRFKFEYAFTADDDELFAGQKAWMIHYPENENVHYRWFPNEDLTDIEAL